jgi:SAM-dependent methyltransferase
MTDKVYEASHEVRGDLMSEADKVANTHLAGCLYINHIKKPGKHISIGSKFAWFAKSLQELGCESWAVDGIKEVEEFNKQLGIRGYQMDWENDQPNFPYKFDSVDMIHVLEHMYDPVEALKKLASIIRSGGIVFLRFPNHQVTGFERDMTPGHWTIHPVVYCESAFYELLSKVEEFQCYEFYNLNPGQSDALLRRL